MYTRMKKDIRIKSKTSRHKTGNIETEANELLRRNKISVSTWLRVGNHVQTCVQNRVRNHDPNRVQNRVPKITNIANKDMSFLKIIDHKKRDFIVNEFLKTMQNIQQNFLSERFGDLSTQYELSKLFKPVMDMQNNLKEGLAFF